MAIADAHASPRTDEGPLPAYERALEDLVGAAQALYEAWGQVLLAGASRTPGVLTHLAREWAERIQRETRDPEVVHEALLVATHALAGIAEEMYADGVRHAADA